MLSNIEMKHSNVRRNIYCYIKVACHRIVQFAYKVIFSLHQHLRYVGDPEVNMSKECEVTFTSPTSMKFH